MRPVSNRRGPFSRRRGCLTPPPKRDPKRIPALLQQRTNVVCKSNVILNSIIDRYDPMFFSIVALTGTDHDDSKRRGLQFFAVLCRRHIQIPHHQPNVEQIEVLAPSRLVLLVPSIGTCSRNTRRVSPTTQRLHVMQRRQLSSV